MAGGHWEWSSQTPRYSRKHDGRVGRNSSKPPCRGTTPIARRGLSAHRVSRSGLHWAGAWVPVATSQPRIPCMTASRTSSPPNQAAYPATSSSPTCAPTAVTRTSPALSSPGARAKASPTNFHHSTANGSTAKPNVSFSQFAARLSYTHPSPPTT